MHSHSNMYRVWVVRSIAGTARYDGTAAHKFAKPAILVSVIRFLKRSWFVRLRCARCIFNLLSMVTVSMLPPPRAARRSGRWRRRGRCGAWNASSLPVHSAQTRTRASLPDLRMRPVERNQKRRMGKGREMYTLLDRIPM